MSISNHQESSVLSEDASEFRVVGLTSPEMRIFLQGIYRKMTRFLNQLFRMHFFTLCLALGLLAGCGKAEPEHPALPGPLPDQAGVLTIMEDQFERLEDPKYFVLAHKTKLPGTEDLSQIREIRFVSGSAGHMDFNESDIYIDPYDKNDDPIPPWAQLSFPRPLIEKTPGVVRISFPGQELMSRVRMVQKFRDPEELSCYRLRLRILLTDRTQPGNPIKMILIGTFWEDDH